MRANSFAGTPASQNPVGGTAPKPGPQEYTSPDVVPDDAFTLSGAWSTTDESVTAKSAAVARLNFNAQYVYLDVGGTGTITATVASGTSAKRRTLEVQLSPGLTAYSFTFG